MHFNKGSTLTWQTQDIFNIPAGFLLSFSLSFIPFQGNCKFYHLRLILPIAVLHLHGIVPYLLFYIWLLSLHIWDPSMLLPSCVWLFATPWIAAHQASLSLTVSQSWSKFKSIALVMPSSHLILWCPLLLLPSIVPSIRDFSNESAVHTRRPKYWSFSFSISPSNKYSGLISLKIDWFDLLAVHRTFRSLLQHHSLKASILRRSAFFRVCHNHTWPLVRPYSLDGMDLCRQSIVSAF